MKKVFDNITSLSHSIYYTEKVALINTQDKYVKVKFTPIIVTRSKIILILITVSTVTSVTSVTSFTTVTTLSTITSVINVTYEALQDMGNIWWPLR